MEKSEISWPQYIVYIFVMIFVFVASTAFGQMKAVHFNAEWNKDNNVVWFDKLSDVKKEHMDVGSGDCQAKYKIAVVPTIIIFKDGEEVARFQADLSFKMVATREEVQEEIDNIIMSDF